MANLLADKCPRCGDEKHDIFACPHVKALEFDGDNISRVEFLTPVDFPRPAAAEPGAIDGSYPKLGGKP